MRTSPFATATLGVLAAVGALGTLATLGSAQAQEDDWKRDPYTAGKPAVRKRAGYTSLTADWPAEVARELPSARIRWVETAHFVIGSSLGSMPMPKASKARRRLAKELGALRKKLPSIQTRGRTIDPWMRLHLYAHRCEELYGQVQFLLRVVDKDFPKTTKDSKPQSSAQFMGWGPYLGMRGKYRLLLLNRLDDLARYNSFCNHNPGNPSTPFHNMDGRAGSLLYGTSPEVYREQRDPAHALHCQVRFDIVQNLLKGYRHYDFVLPAWIMEGIGNALLRDFDPKHFTYSGLKVRIVKSTRNNDWKAMSRKLVKNGFAPKAAKLCVAASAQEFSLHDQVGAWSRVDFLRQRDDGRPFAEFLRLMKGPHPATGKAVPFHAVLARQEAALQQAFGLSFGEFDAKWQEYGTEAIPLTATCRPSGSSLPASPASPASPA